MGNRKVATTVYLTTVQDVTLKELGRRTGLPVAELVRRGVDLILAEYAVMDSEKSPAEDAARRPVRAQRQR